MITCQGCPAWVARTNAPSKVTFETCPVVGVANGRQALDSLANRPRPSLILLDLLMPVMNGWVFCEHVRRDPDLAKIPIVVMSGAVSRDPASPYFIDVDAFVTKPIYMETLLATLERILRSGARSLELR